MIVSVLKREGEALSPSQILEQLERRFRLEPEQPRRLAEKRVELRLRDLARFGLIQDAPGGAFRYAVREPDADGLVERAVGQLENDRASLNRLIYSSSSRARRLAEAFRF